MTASDFARLTSEIDLKAKNTAPPIVSFKGLDPATGVPGLYWITFFSDEYATWLGLRELPKELVTLKGISWRRNITEVLRVPRRLQES